MARTTLTAVLVAPLAVNFAFDGKRRLDFSQAETALARLAKDLAEEEERARQAFQLRRLSGLRSG